MAPKSKMPATLDGPSLRPYLVERPPHPRPKTPNAMALLPIIVAPDPRLKKHCNRIERVDKPIRQLMDDLLETMYEAPGVGPIRLLKPWSSRGQSPRKR